MTATERQILSLFWRLCGNCEDFWKCNQDQPNGKARVSWRVCYPRLSSCGGVEEEES